MLNLQKYIINIKFVKTKIEYPLQVKSFSVPIPILFNIIIIICIFTIHKNKKLYHHLKTKLELHKKPPTCWIFDIVYGVKEMKHFVAQLLLSRCSRCINYEYFQKSIICFTCDIMINFILNISTHKFLFDYQFLSKISKH